MNHLRNFVYDIKSYFSVVTKLFVEVNLLKSVHIYILRNFVHGIQNL
jgi:hypothetical protein